MNRFSKTGGKLIEYKQAILVMHEVRQKEVGFNTLRYAPNNPVKFRKNPNHWHNKTRNIKPANETHPVKIHINNITLFNGLPVVF